MKSPVPVIVDKLPSPAPDHFAVTGLHLAEAALVVSLITLFGVLIQIWLARRTLDVTNEELTLTRETLKAAQAELELAVNQLGETRRAAEQTKLALDYSKEQSLLAKREAIDRVKQISPQLTAEVRFDELAQKFVVWLVNHGGVARYVGLSALDPAGQLYSRAGNTLQILGANEQQPTGLKWPNVPSSSRYAQKVRIRYSDIYGNKYITEYRSLSDTLAYPVFREPWLGKEYGFPPPEKCSEFVSWPVEHYERIVEESGVVEYDEELDPGLEPHEAIASELGTAQDNVPG